jgi:hypothetical protein
MKTMEEKAAEVVARWLTFHPGGAPSAEPTTTAKKPGSTKIKSIDWNEWERNMRSAIGKTAIVIQGLERGNRNAALAKLKSPVTWYDNIAVGETDDFPGWWCCVPPEGFAVSFVNKEGLPDAKTKATEMAQELLRQRGPKL